MYPVVIPVPYIMFIFCLGFICFKKKAKLAKLAKLKRKFSTNNPFFLLLVLETYHVFVVQISSAIVVVIVIIIVLVFVQSVITLVVVQSVVVFVVVKNVDVPMYNNRCLHVQGRRRENHPYHAPCRYPRGSWPSSRPD